ncbi:MAG: hypothetical protein GY730_00220, partial [bacterium]|nr:hypothetical protein [bacterium]
KYGLENRKYCLFFCGSRKQHFMNLIPLMRDAVNLIKSEDKNFSPVLLVSPFISDQDFKAAGDEFDLSDFIVLRGDSLELMSISDFLVTIPGTNNAEAMYMNLPMLVFLPLNRPELIILDGVAGLIGNLPFAGRIIKTIIVMIMAKRKMYYSLPNRVAGKGIVPEIIGVVDAEIIAKEICKYYYDKDQLKKIKKNLSCFNNNKEIAKKICLTVLEDLQDV